MARSAATELRVGVFTIACLGIVAFAWLRFGDGVRSDVPMARVDLLVPSADGLYVGTPVKVAGVEVGAVDVIEIEGNRARLGLAVKKDQPLPVDTTARLVASGLLGDRHVALDLGPAEQLLADGGRIPLGREPGSIDEITAEFQDIAEDVKAITKVVRELVEDRRNTEAVEATLLNVEAITAEVRLLAETNRHDVDAIVDSVRRLTANLETLSVDASADVDEEFEKLKDATDDLDLVLEDLKSVTGKVDAGEGTLGALVNDRETIDALNDTIDNANQVIKSVSGLRAEVYYVGRLYGGSQPKDPAFFYGNPLAPNLDGGFGYSGSNTIGVELRPQEDFWYLFEVNDYPQGVIRSEQHFFPDTGVAYTEWTRDLSYRFTFQMARRWRGASFRLGLKEGGGGVGVTGYLLRDRLMINVDAFDFAFGSYPALESAGIPNLRVAARAEPVHHVWLEAGGEQLLLGAKYGYATGYVGLGFHFSDDDVKLLLATLPFSL